MPTGATDCVMSMMKIDTKSATARPAGISAIRPIRRPTPSTEGVRDQARRHTAPKRAGRPSTASRSTTVHADWMNAVPTVSVSMPTAHTTPNAVNTGRAWLHSNSVCRSRSARTSSETAA